MAREIKISEAKNLAKEFNFDMVIVIGINQDRSGHITTYGKNKVLCKLVGYIGQSIIGKYLFGKKGYLESLNNESVEKILKEK